MPQSNRIAVSMDVSFDEHFTSALLLTCNPFQYAMILHQHESPNIDEYDTLEHTASDEYYSSMFEEGNVTTKNVTTNPYNPSENPNVIDEDDDHNPIITQNS